MATGEVEELTDEQILSRGKTGAGELSDEEMMLQQSRARQEEILAAPPAAAAPALAAPAAPVATPPPVTAAGIRPPTPTMAPVAPAAVQAPVAAPPAAQAPAAPAAAPVVIPVARPPVVRPPVAPVRPPLPRIAAEQHGAPMFQIDPTLHELTPLESWWGGEVARAREPRAEAQTSAQQWWGGEVGRAPSAPKVEPYQGKILPFKIDEQGRRYWAMPDVLRQFWSSVKAPKEAMDARLYVDEEGNLRSTGPGEEEALGVALMAAPESRTGVVTRGTEKILGPKEPAIREEISGIPTSEQRREPTLGSMPEAGGPKEPAIKGPLPEPGGRKEPTVGKRTPAPKGPKEPKLKPLGGTIDFNDLK